MIDLLSYAMGKAAGGGGGGGGDITVEPLSVTENNTYQAPAGKAYTPVTVAVPNSYSASDEGKVVSNGALVAQTAHAEVTQNGTIDTTLNNSVTVNVAEKWNYIWDASMESLPWGMTANSYDFTTETGTMYVVKPFLDFSHLGDCEIEFEAKFGANNNGTSPQICVKSGELSGFKIWPTADGTLNSNVSGSNETCDISPFNYHVYNMKISGNTCTLTIDGTPITGPGVTNNQYLSRTGIDGTATVSRNFFVKSIKYSGGSYAELLSQLTNTRMVVDTLVGGAE